jgi:hypothetical protein
MGSFDTVIIHVDVAGEGREIPFWVGDSAIFITLVFGLVFFFITLSIWNW